MLDRLDGPPSKGTKKGGPSFSLFFFLAFSLRLTLAQREWVFGAGPDSRWNLPLPSNGLAWDDERKSTRETGFQLDSPPSHAARLFLFLLPFP
ncbi:hypothetical protein LZ30DRAFT_451225 [Colletotrichum cereale]|nr:hypothetical protein LZ30DRAFT_451225 [Colletotrichum cereale]